MIFDLISGEVTVKVNTSGAELNSLEHNEIEYLWQGDTNIWGGQAPVCFPITGALRDSKATAFGKECTMQRHGVARRQEFKASDISDKSVTFSLKANEETLLQYPFDFELKIKYILDGTLLNIEYTVINHDNCKMPFAIGGHPAFNCPLAKNEEFTDYYVQFENAEDSKCLRPDAKTGLINDERFEVLDGTDKLHLFHYLFTKDAMVFDDLKSKKVSLKSTKSSRGMTMCFDDFSNFLIWSSVGAVPFIALEPWSAAAQHVNDDDCLEHRKDIIILDSGESKTLKFSIEVF